MSGVGQMKAGEGREMRQNDLGVSYGSWGYQILDSVSLCGCLPHS